MNFESLIITGVLLIVALYIAYKMIKFGSNTEFDNGDSDEYAEIRKPAKLMGFAIIIGVTLLVLVKLNHFNVVEVPTGSPTAGNEMQTTSSPPSKASAPSIDAVGGKTTMDEASKAHKKQLENFKNGN